MLITKLQLSGQKTPRSVMTCYQDFSLSNKNNCYRRKLSCKLTFLPVCLNPPLNRPAVSLAVIKAKELYAKEAISEVK